MAYPDPIPLESQESLYKQAVFFKKQLEKKTKELETVIATLKEAIQKRIDVQRQKRYNAEDACNFRSAELAEFHENGLREALDIMMDIIVMRVKK